MARPVVPDVDKKRTVPLRLTKPLYRSLGILLEVTGKTIQELLREGTEDLVKKYRAKLTEADVTIPSEYWVGEMTDDQYNAWLAAHGNRPQEPRRRGFGRRAAA